MAEKGNGTIRETLDRIYASESRRILATLIRLLGDIDCRGRAARRLRGRRGKIGPCKAFQPTRRVARLHRPVPGHRRAAAAVAIRCLPSTGPGSSPLTEDLPDASWRRNPRRPAAADLHLLPPGAQRRSAQRGAVAAHAVRIVDRRDRARLSGAPADHGATDGARQAQDPRRRHSVRGAAAQPVAERLDAVMAVVYLVFNEGYTATTGETLVRTDLCAEAIRLGRLLVRTPAARRRGTRLLALLLLQESRRAARTSPERRPGAARRSGPITVEPDQIAEGSALVERAWPRSASGRTPCRPSRRSTRPPRPRGDGLGPDRGPLRHTAGRQPSPVVELNRAVAVAMSDDPQIGLPSHRRDAGARGAGRLPLGPLRARGALPTTGKDGEALVSFQKALTLARLAPERSFLEGGCGNWRENHSLSNRLRRST